MKMINTGKGCITLLALLGIWSVSALTSLPGLAVSPISDELAKIFPSATELDIQLLTTLPSLLIILAIAMFFQSFQDVPWVAAVFAGIRPAVVALIAIPTWNMAKSAGINMMNCWIPIGSAMLIWLLGVNPIYIILAAGVGGYLYGQFLKPSE